MGAFSFLRVGESGGAETLSLLLPKAFSNILTSVSTSSSLFSFIFLEIRIRRAFTLAWYSYTLSFLA